jgi:hypothetical protein
LSDVSAPLACVHAAIDELGIAADAASARWAVPRAPGKWSPSQVVEHVARIMEESAKVAAGAPSQFPTMPFLLRPIIRILVFKRTLWRRAFPKMKAIEAFVPEAGSASPSEGRVRLQGALDRFEEACRARAAQDQKVASTIFGAVGVGDFARFQELHVRHHTPQMAALP